MRHKFLHGFASFILALGISVAGFAPVLAAPPTNDNFADATEITSLPFSSLVDITEAGVEPDEPQSCFATDRTAWFVFTPEETMSIRITKGGNTTFSNISVFTAAGTNITDLTLYWCPLYNPTPQTVVAGQTYYIQAGAYPGEVGTIGVNVEQAFPPANDNFANTEEILSPFSSNVDVSSASLEPGEVRYCSMENLTVWYSFTPSEDMVIQANVLGSAIASQVTIYSSTSPDLSSINFLGCSLSTFNLTAQAGQTYYFQVGRTQFGQFGNIQLDLVELLPPGNDNFANATSISSLPSTIDFDTGAATFESNEPPTCGYPSPPYKTIWYAFTASQDGSISASIPTSNFAPFLAVYSGTDFNNLIQLGCGQYSNKVTIHVIQGQTYYFQVGGYYGEGGPGQFLLENAPAPEANFYFYPGDPSKYDTIQFCSSSNDPGNVGIESFTWDFGDGATATTGCATHQYTVDGDYTVQHTVTTFDGRTAAATPQVVQVRTHDVSITKMTTPNSANAGQTKTITVNLRNIAYPETVQVDLYKSTPNGFVWVATVTNSVPALSGNRTTAFNFSYIFTSDDARIGKVTFKAVATIIGARDAWPSDNEKISLITKVVR